MPRSTIWTSKKIKICNISKNGVKYELDRRDNKVLEGFIMTYNCNSRDGEVHYEPIHSILNYWLTVQIPNLINLTSYRQKSKDLGQVENLDSYEIWIKYIEIYDLNLRNHIL